MGKKNRIDGRVSSFSQRIYQKVSGPNVASKFRTNGYHICKENLDFLWVHTTDFSKIKSIGQSTSFYWELNAGLSISDLSTYFPCYKEDINCPSLESGEEFSSPSEVVPLVKYPSDSKLAYEIIFHTQKISIAAVDSDLIGELSVLPVEIAVMILQKLHKLQSPCYDPVAFVKASLPTGSESCNACSMSRWQE